MTDRTKIAKKYLKLLSKGNTLEILSLFSVGATIDSPLFGEIPASEFYAKLKEISSSSTLTLIDILENPEKRTLALYFNYKWCLKNKETTNFDVVDLIQFDGDNKITSLKIIYDARQSSLLI